MTITQITATAVVPTSTPEFSCWKKDKRECAIAESLGIDLDSIISFSPDLKWVVIYNIKLATSWPGKDIGGLRFVKTDNSKEWMFDATQMSQDIGECSLIFTANAWSPDSHYIYFSPDPGYCSRMRYVSDYGTQVLYRLDVLTGEFIEYLSFSDGVNSTVGRKLDLYNLAFSPDGIYLAYLKTLNAPMIIHIRNLETEKEIIYKMPAKYPEAGCLVWSSNSHFLFFYAATTTAYEKSTLSSFYKIDMDNHSIKEIIQSQPYLFCISDYDPIEKDDFVFVTRADTSYNVSEEYYFNPYTEEFIVQPTPTPYPPTPTPWPSSIYQP
jgi:hypothetical protein